VNRESAVFQDRIRIFVAVDLAGLAGDAAIQEVSGIELNSGFGRLHHKHATGLWIIRLCYKVLLRTILSQYEIVIITLPV
jgi:hypothetical protein